MNLPLVLLNRRRRGVGAVSYIVLGLEPDLVLDFGREYYAYDQWAQYQAQGIEPDLVADFVQETYGA